MRPSCWTSVFGSFIASNWRSTFLGSEQGNIGSSFTTKTTPRWKSPPLKPAEMSSVSSFGRLQMRRTACSMVPRRQSFPATKSSPIKEMIKRGFQVTERSAGVQIENPNYGDDVAPMTLRRLLNNKIFLSGAIVLMVIVLGWVLVCAGGRINEIPPT